MRRRPPARNGGTGYEPAYADSAPLRSITAGLSDRTAAAIAAVAPDLVEGAPRDPSHSSLSHAAPAEHVTVVPDPVVRLGFADSSTFDFQPADPWAVALLALAGELLSAK
jgi:hypothetical protein